MKRFTICFVILSVIIVGNVDAQRLIIYTEEFPPFNFTEKGKITGVSTEIVHHVMAKTGLEYQIISLPWEQTLKKGRDNPDSLIFSIGRSKDREPLFNWIGIITPTTYFVMALKSRADIKINSLEDLKNYKIGTTTGDIAEDWLINKGFNASELFRSTGDNANLKTIQNLLNKRIDVCPFPDAVANHIVRKAGHSNPALLLNKVFPIEQLSGGYYLAASLKTSDKAVLKISRALRRFKQSNEYYKVLAHWGVDAMGVKTEEPIAKLIYTLKNFNRIVTVGYLAADNMSAHRNGGLYRKEMREEFHEAYVSTFDQWLEQFKKMQSKVDALIIGDITGIKGWNNKEARNFVQTATVIPTGCLRGAVSDLALFGYEADNFIINKKIAEKLKISIPNSYIKKANKIIE
jgi:polar amino acid transport system substrate-binding protein